MGDHGHLIFGKLVAFLLVFRSMASVGRYRKGARVQEGLPWRQHTAYGGTAAAGTRVDTATGALSCGCGARPQYRSSRHFNAPHAPL
jgi:hypothetical protein